ncbi:MAG: endonuclease/exonuclease/phosphatase family protein, partial [Thiomargarita sp.]|nr:endonuclease/exonuclease/phosphatase family protein [Thiomargarita sp.]
YPIQWDQIRTFQNFLWKDMPDAQLPKDQENGESWYSTEILDIFRLSSKNHVDVPIALPNGVIHALIAHPTPPICEGDEHRNRLRNFDEIRLLADYITPNKGDYLYDDHGQRGGLTPKCPFVIMGDMNADPRKGDSLDNAIHQLLKHDNIHTIPAHPTSSWGLQVDYVLPSKSFKLGVSGVFLPQRAHPLYHLIEKSSDHRLVWVDVRL